MNLATGFIKYFDNFLSNQVIISLEKIKLNHETSQIFAFLSFKNNKEQYNQTIVATSE